MEKRFELDQLLRDYARSDRAKKTVEAGKALTCPEPHELAGFAFGHWDEAKANLMRAHLLVCAACARRVEEIRSHLDLGLLGCHLAGLIPAGAGGDVLRLRVAAHLGACPRCQARAETLRSGILEWSGGRLVETARAELVALMHGLAAATIASSRRKRAARAMSVGDRGARRGGNGEVEALVFGADGRLLVDPEGNPRTASFSIERAEIDPERGVMIKLSTADPELRAKTRAKLEVTLEEAGRILRFDPIELTHRGAQAFVPSGVVILRAPVPPDSPRVEIPAGTLRLKVTLLA